jgi:hypothetical protein
LLQQLLGSHVRMMFTGSPSPRPEVIFT